MRQLFVKTSAALVTALGVLAAHAGILPGPVVSTKWLAENLDKVQVVEVRSNVKSFTEKPEVETDAKTGKKAVTEVGGHIPNSRLVDMKNMRTERTYGDLKVKYMIPEKTVFEKAMQAAGVDTAKPMVLVAVGADATDLDDALRVYWQLKVYGEDDMAVLDGGMATWLLEGREYSTAAAPAKTGTWVAKADRSAQYFATSEDVAKAIADKSAVLIDSRDARQYHGLGKRDYVYAYGHLDGAKLYGPDLMVNASAGTVKFMAANTYRGLMAAQGIDPAAPAITYCNSGHLSSGPWFVASEILGNKSAKLYDGSLHQWTLEKRPLVGAVSLN
ncbi:MAG: sulfurtransferase [Burkholderiales bacterium]|nr:sulfurtransferase [Burkholderiales bacterium]